MTATWSLRLRPYRGHARSYKGMCSEGDLHGIGAALGLAVEYRLDVVAVGIDHERPVVPGVVRAFARRAIVLAAGGKPGLMKGLDRRAVLGLEREVAAACGLAVGGFAVGCRLCFRLSATGITSASVCGSASALNGGLNSIVLLPVTDSISLRVAFNSRFTRWILTVEISG